MLQEGLILLGRILKASEYELKVSLPGGFQGCVRATDISQSYTNLLRNIIQAKTIQWNEFKPLPDLFKPGDYVTCYVKSTTCVNDEDKWVCSLSMEPQLINQNIHTNYFAKGTKVVCAVESKEDYCYVIDTGIANVRAFIDTKNVDKGKQYCKYN